MTKAEEIEKKEIDDSIKRKLRDSHWQEGLTWRKKMIQIIAQLRRDGVSEDEIFRELKKCGLTNHTANRLMDDAEYIDSKEQSVFDMSPEEYAEEIDRMRKQESATEYMKTQKQRERGKTN